MKFALVLFALCAASAFAIPATLQIRESATVESEFVRLADVADLGALAPALREALDAVVVGRAPGVGATRIWTREDLRTAIRRAQPDGAAPGFAGADSVAVTRQAGHAPDAEAASAIEDAIRRFAPCAETAARATCEIDIREVVPALRPGPRLPLVVRDAEPGAPLWTLTLLEIDPAAGSREIRVRASVRFFAEAAVARRALRAQHPVSPADFEARRTEVQPGEHWLAVGAAPAGRRLQRPVRIGEVLCEEALVPAALVRARESVRVEVPGPGFSLRIDGQALETGAAGEVIRIKNVNSGAVVRARVTARGVAELVASAETGEKR